MAANDTKASRSDTATARPPKVKASGSRPSGRGRRLRRIFFWFPLLLLLGVVAAAPSLISWTPLGRQLIARFAPVDGSVEVGSLSVGWFSPLTLTDVVARDPAGEVVAQVAAVRGDKPLWRLMTDRQDLGKFEIEQPSANLVLRADGSNLEDFLQPLMTGGGGQPISVAVKVTDGAATVDDRPTRRNYQFQDLALDAAWQGAGDHSLNLQSSGKFIDGRNTSDLSLLVSAEVGDDQHPLGKGRLTCHCDQLPLDVIEPILRRQLDGAQLAGRISVQFDGNWGGGADWGESLIDGQIDLADFLFTAPALGSDRLEMAKLHAPCRIVGKQGRLEIEELLLDCDLGKLQVIGSVDTTDLTPANLIASLPYEACQVTGRLDLVRLAALFPSTLSLRAGTEITAGELNLSLISQPANGGSNWTGTLDTSDLEAMADGRPVAWKQPLAVSFRVRDAGAGLIVDKLDCTSSFLHVEGSGTPQNFTATADFDLAKLAAELARFVDLAAFELAGTGQANVTCQADVSGQLKAQSDAAIHDFALVAPNRRPWHEPQLTIHGEAAATLDGGALDKVETASLQIQTQSDQVTLLLTEAVDHPASATWPVQIDWQGDLAGLVPRVSPWFDLSGWDISGQGTLSATAKASTGTVEIQQIKGTVQRLHAWSQGLFIDEPTVELSASGRWQRASNKIEVPLAAVHGGNWVGRVNNAELHQAGPNIESTGNATLEADLTTIGRWLVDPRAAAALPLSGQLAGKLDWSTKDVTNHATLAATIDNWQLALPAPPARQPGEQTGPAVWQEQRITLSVDLDYDQANDLLTLDHGQLAASALEAQLAGKIADATKTPDVDVSGQIVADWARLAPLWRPYAGPKVTIEGSEPWPFSLRGRWTPGATPALAGLQQMTGQAQVSWTSANVFGLPIDRGSVNAALKDGTLSITPVNVSVSGGKVLLAPIVHLAAQPAMIELPRGPAIEAVELTPEVSAQALKFVAPVLNEVTRTSGQFSITLQGGQLPLANPLAADVAGQFQVHAVEMHPGPILQSLLGFAQQIEGLAKGQIPFANGTQPVSLIKIENQAVEFRMVDGRVYHRGLQFTAGNVTITTRGSVGLDETLSMVAEIPMNAGLMGNNSKLKGMNTDSMQIPIEGTLKHPKLDPLAVEKLTASLIKNTTRNLLFNNVEKGLGRLIPGADGQPQSSPGAGEQAQ
jgi:translocation and assembly module TamB